MQMVRLYVWHFNVYCPLLDLVDRVLHDPQNLSLSRAAENVTFSLFMHTNLFYCY